MERRILNSIKDTDDIKKLNKSEINLLSKEVRDYIIEVVSKNGGHLASSLGVVELSIALLRSFDFKRDKVIWDVGHQSYAYKILTGRYELFKTLRNLGGISGFPKREESRFDVFNTGHSSTSISAGMGMCVARDLNNEDYKVISVIGDGAMTAGMAFEALNNLSELKKNFIIILNDNEMSISKSSGGINKALLGIRTSNKYTNVKNQLNRVLENSKIGLIFKKILITIINIFKQIVVSDGMLFENLNINYVGPIDGHNVKELTEVFDTVKNFNEPVLIHIKTIKGKGYKYAEENPTLFHGVPSFDIETGNLEIKKDKTYTNIVSEELVKIATTNEKVVAITAAMADGTGLIEFSKKFPNRFFDVGICEQHAVTFAAGMAVENIIPVVCIYSSFLQRGFDQIIHDVCLQNLHVVFLIDRAGIVGNDGETHQGLFDISYLRLIPNMVVMAPKTGMELRKMIRYAIYDLNSPVAIRYPRGISFENCEIDEKIIFGKSEIINWGEDLAILALGSMVETAIRIKEKLNKNITIINARFAKPIDYDIIDKICNSNHKKIIILEEAIKIGGIGEDIESYIKSKNYDILVNLINIDDENIEQGSISELKKKLKIDVDGIIDNFL